jgi:photosystem II stability/assembly factor-like uncharacterized protein
MVPGTVCALVAAALVLVQCSEHRPTSTPTDVLAVSRNVVAFKVMAEGPPSLAQTIQVSNESGYPLEYSVEHYQPWLTLFYHGRTLDTIFAYAAGRELLEGDYADTIKITAGDAVGSPLKIAINLHVDRGLKTGPGSFHLFWLIGSPSIQPLPLIIAPTGGGTMPYQIESTVPWVRLSSPNGIARDTQTVSFSLASAHTGTYIGQINISSAEAVNSPQKVPCSLSIVSWGLQALGGAYALHGVKFLSATEGLAIGYKRVAFGRDGYAFRTHDGGNTWNPEMVSSNAGLLGMTVVSPTRIYAFGENGQIMRSGDGGDFWVPMGIGGKNINAVVSPGPDTIYAFSSNGNVSVSFNDGALWQPKTSPVVSPISGAHFFDTQSGWVVGNEGVVMFTNDGCATWTVVPVTSVANLNAIYMYDRNTGWIVGSNGTILTRTDGTKWHLQISPTASDLWSVHFIDRQTGWITGDGGTVLFTDDGGLHWEIQPTQTRFTISAIDFLNPNVGLAVGNGGVIMNTLNGGRSQ